MFRLQQVECKIGADPRWMGSAVAETVLKCPQCGGTLTPSRFARSVSCPYCGSTVRLGEPVVSAKRFHEAYRLWNSPESYGVTSWMTFDGGNWTVDSFVARGEVADASKARRARWPTEIVLLKVLRSRDHEDRFRSEWDVLQKLQRSGLPAAPEMTLRVPVPVSFGRVEAGVGTGSLAMALRWAPGFEHTFEDVCRFWPQGIEPRISIWMWRRILEALSFVHSEGLVHGAVTPEHLLVEDKEHGVRLVGYGLAGPVGTQMAAGDGTPAARPRWADAGCRRAPAIDLAMSARAIAYVLGGDPDDCSLPSAVPGQLQALVGEIGAGTRDALDGTSAWEVRQELGRIATAVYGPAKYCPLMFPGEVGND